MTEFYWFVISRDHYHLITSVFFTVCFVCFLQVGPAADHLPMHKAASSPHSLYHPSSFSRNSLLSCTLINSSVFHSRFSFFLKTLKIEPYIGLNISRLVTSQYWKKFATILVEISHPIFHLFSLVDCVQNCGEWVCWEPLMLGDWICCPSWATLLGILKAFLFYYRKKFFFCFNCSVGSHKGETFLTWI